MLGLIASWRLLERVQARWGRGRRKEGERERERERERGGKERMRGEAQGKKLLCNRLPDRIPAKSHRSGVGYTRSSLPSVRKQTAAS